MVLGNPKPSLKLAGAQPLKPTLPLELLGRFWAGAGSLGAWKPHPVHTESSRLCRAPGGRGVPTRLRLLSSLRPGLTVALR